MQTSDAPVVRPERSRNHHVLDGIAASPPMTALETRILCHAPRSLPLAAGIKPAANSDETLSYLFALLMLADAMTGAPAVRA